MSAEDELSRQLRAKAAGVHSEPDIGDLLERISTRDRRARRHERVALGAAVLVLAASVGGLAGALVSVPRVRQADALQSRYAPGRARVSPTRPAPALRNGPAHPGPVAGSAPEAPRTVISRQLAGGLSVVASLQNFPSPVAITDAWSAALTCTTGEIVTTTVGEDGSFGGGTSVAQLPRLSTDGLAVLSSGVLQLAGGAQEWWVTASVGPGVARVAAENLGGNPVTVLPSAGIAVIAGPMSGPDTGSGEMSAVAESGTADASLGFLLGAGPKAVGESAVLGDASGCSALTMPAEPSSAPLSQPADPGLAAGSIVAAFDQAYSANALLGFAANLAAVSGGARLSAGSSPPAKVTRRRAGSNGGVPKTARATMVPVMHPRANRGSPEVRQISFLSAVRADVVYRTTGGVLLTGQAELGSSGIWHVTLSTFCGNLASGIVAGDAPAAVVSACDATR